VLAESDESGGSPGRDVERLELSPSAVVAMDVSGAGFGAAVGLAGTFSGADLAGIEAARVKLGAPPAGSSTPAVFVPGAPGVSGAGVVEVVGGSASLLASSRSRGLVSTAFTERGGPMAFFFLRM
jgi:hypothetical protein